MQIEVLTIFPGYFASPLAESLLGKAIGAGLVEVLVTDLRDFAADRHHKVDDEAYGGGPGMVMLAPVVAAAVEARRGEPARLVGLSDARRAAARPGEGPGAGRPAEAPALLRPVRGRRRARSTGRPVRRRDIARRLRAAGWRGRRPRRRRGGHAPGAGRRRPGGVRRGGVVHGRAPGLPALHAAARISGAAGSGCARLGRPRPDRAMAAGAGSRADARAPARPAWRDGPRSPGKATTEFLAKLRNLH